MPCWRPPEQGCSDPNIPCPQVSARQCHHPVGCPWPPWGAAPPQGHCTARGVPKSVGGGGKHPVPCPTPPQSHTSTGVVVMGTSVPKNRAVGEAWGTGIHIGAGIHWQGLGHTVGGGLGHARGGQGYAWREPGHTGRIQDMLRGSGTHWGGLEHTGETLEHTAGDPGRAGGTQDTLRLLGHRQVKHRGVTGHTGGSSAH